MTTSTEEASRLGLGQQLARLGRTYWLVNTMEMLERLGYYGLRTVLPIYMVLSTAQGGPEFDHVQKGTILAWWAAIQSFVPVFTGGYADRYGYKLSVGVSIAIKVVGYLVMGLAVPLAALLSGGASTTTPGHPAVFWVFTVGALFLAFGTAVFKPGIQGLLAKQMDQESSALGWSIFYQVVNIGGFLGPYLASVMRLLDWQWVFFSCAAVVCLNYPLLLTFREPERVAGQGPSGGPLWTLWSSFIGICQPRLLSFLVVFSGFWMMFYQLFDLLPNFITDWVDSRSVLETLVRPVLGASVPAEWNGQVPAEQLINLNSGMIMIFAFAVGYLTSKMRSMTAMIFGILVSALAIAALTLSADGWVVLGAIALFSFGEMWASPTKSRYVTGIAPPGQTGLYLGYVNATVGIGWSIGSRVAGDLYQNGGDPTVLGRRWLSAQGVEADRLAKDDVLARVAEQAGTSLEGARALLWDAYEPQQIWWRFAAIGVLSMFGLMVFEGITRFVPSRWEVAALVALTFFIALGSYGPGWGLLFTGLMLAWVALQRWAPQLLAR